MVSIVQAAPISMAHAATRAGIAARDKMELTVIRSILIMKHSFLLTRADSSRDNRVIATLLLSRGYFDATASAGKSFDRLSGFGV